jgi:hypothetical protein
MTKAPPRMRDFSIDLETLDTRPSAVILAIGCAQFDRYTGAIGAKFYKQIELKSAMAGGTISADTLRWWMTQGNAARAVFLQATESFAMSTCLQEFASWVRSTSAGVPIVWGNGATFDITILEHAFRNCSVGLSEPWHFTNIRDMRTAVDLLDAVKPGFKSKVKNVGTHHNAVNDAEYQAGRIAECFIELGAKRGKSTDDQPLDDLDDL